MKRSDATSVTTKPPVLAASLNFSVKTLDQIRAEKKRKQPVPEDSDATSGSRPSLDKPVGPVSQSRHEVALNDQAAEASDKDLSKELAPPKKRLVIKRSSLRKNAESAEMEKTRDVDVKKRKVDSSDEADGTSVCTTTKKNPPSKTDQKDTYFDATCIDKSVPLPDSKQVPVTESRKTDRSGRSNPSQDRSNTVTKELDQAKATPLPDSTQEDTGTHTVATSKRVTILKGKRKSEPSPPAREISSELDIDASLLLSPMDESRSLVGGVPERKKSIAEMKAEM